MTTLIDFSSLFQLGFGTGIALGLFQAPIRLRLDPLAVSTMNQLLLLQGATEESAKVRYRELQSLQVELALVVSELERRQRPALIFSVLGAFVNLGLLCWASVDADRVVQPEGELLLVAVGVGWFLAVLLWMEILVLDVASPLLSKRNTA